MKMLLKLAVFQAMCFVALASVVVPTFAVSSTKEDVCPVLPKLLFVIQGVGYVQRSKGAIVPVTLYLVYKEKDAIGIPENKYFEFVCGLVKVGVGQPIVLKEGYAILDVLNKKVKLFAEVKNIDLGGTAVSLSGTFIASETTLKMKLNGTLRSWTIIYPLHIWATGTLQPVEP